jgi:hypothetical protein
MKDISNTHNKKKSHYHYSVFIILLYCPVNCFLAGSGKDMGVPWGCKELDLGGFGYSG